MVEDFPKSTNVVISASYNPLHLPLRTGVLHLRAEASTDTRRTPSPSLTSSASLLLCFTARKRP